MSEDDRVDDKIVWVDAAGCEYRMQDIGDSHLRNIVAFLERHADAAESYFFQGEYAQDAADSAAAYMRDRAEEFRGEISARGML